MDRYVSDAVVDVLRELGCRYLPLNPGSSFRGLHDSLVNYADGSGPQMILCTHEEIAVAAAHAYAKATGDVGFAVVHDLVGLMHASMAVYDAWCDRAPLVVLGGGGPADPADRRPIDWFHSANVQSSLVRPFVKWDDDPVAPQAMLDGIVQARRMAASAPQGPTYVTLDAAVQEQPDTGLVSTAAAGLAADPPFAARAQEVEAAVDLLLSATLPVVVAGRVGLDASCTPLLVHLAELLGAACRDERNHTALPTSHPLNLTGDKGLIDEADVVLAVDLHDLSHVLDTRTAPGVPQVIDLSVNSLAVRSWANAGSGLRPADLRLVADPRHGLEQLIDAVTARVGGQDGAAAAARAARSAAIQERHAALRAGQKQALADRWDETPIAVPRLVAEVHEAVRSLPWLLTLRNTRSWPEGIWDFDRGGRYLGHSGGGGIGYGPGAMLGGGLAARDRGEFAVGIIGDGDLLFAPGALWSAVHHQVPMLVVVNNNRSFFNDDQHQAVVARRRGRPAENSHIGTAIHEPEVDFGSIARGHGAWAGEAVLTPEALAPALAAAVQQVLAGRVAVVDVHTAVR
ncbi:MAG: thiamine pyrophosphate-dependent enzyme possible carboligase or decarboxylase [Actinotalea sp.]|nr:thiamine pyrophosphate-dependent enzyme possible carboligase or decarboxylase [Actinotalea sp.]